MLTFAGSLLFIDLHATHRIFAMVNSPPLMGALVSCV